MARALILAGPVVRRVERNRVVVWVALQRPATVRLKVWPGLHAASATTPGEIDDADPHPTREASAETLRFGAKLHVALVDLKLGDLARPAGDPVPPLLDPGSVYSYNLRITPTPVSPTDPPVLPTDLLKEHLLEARAPDLTVSPQRPAGVPLGYAVGQLPSFATCPTDIADLFLLQMSCRKGAAEAPNAGDDPDLGADDLMTAYDPLIENALGDGRLRPHQLFLTGDQIYADETPGPVLPQLTALANELLGTNEILPLDGALAFPLTADNFPAGSRQKLCVESAKFTSSSAASHVIGLGEYYASYVVAWSEEGWDELMDELPPIGESALRDKLTDWQECIRKFSLAEQAATNDEDRTAAREAREKAEKGFAAAKDDFGTQRKRIEGYRINVPLVRRVLANVPTYMIADDHEITDDWNLTQQWRNRVLGTNLGSTILRNGLLAYAVFQAWGNDPKAWSPPEPEDVDRDRPNLKLLTNATKLFATATIDTEARDKIDELLGHAGADVKVKWNYTIDFESHRVVVLDTRTRRELALRHQPPGLLTAEALNAQLPAGPLPAALQVLVVVSAAPVLGPGASEHVIQPLGSIALNAMSAIEFDGEFDPCDGRPLDPFKGQATVDLESWFADDTAVERLFQRLATYKATPIVILSGDVHYGLTAVLDYWKKRAADSADFDQTRIVQFTSSASRNVWPDDLQPLLTFTRQFVPAQRALLSLRAPTERLAWVEEDPTPIAGADDAIRPLRTRLRRNPVLVPSGGWPAAATEQRPPDWAWRLTLVSDVRSDDAAVLDARPEQVRPPRPQVFDEAAPIDGYAAAVARHGAAAAENVQLRTIVAEFNVGGVRFRREPDGILVARSELYSRNYKKHPNPQAATNTAHEVTLAPTTDDRPRIGS